MQIQAIKTRINPVTNRYAQNTNVKQHVSFGFGEDYGNDDFLCDSDHKSDGNLFEYLGLAIIFPFTWLIDTINEKRALKKYQNEKKNGLDKKIDNDELNI